ncbi:MAG: hypothetical protein KDC85_14515 [Saprospiraceae bacterium]|nr:hypothetical protein [Saprospiraceae bacterium]MCB9325132.1 hypothetical protein [Lewinellaceae bacterium]
MRAIQKNSLFFLCIVLFPLSSLFSQEVKVISVIGKGRTTGHIVTITASNFGKKPIAIKPQVFYIPSDRKYQSYVGIIPGGTIIQPGQTVSIYVDGTCTDPHTPPITEGEDVVPIASWVPVEDPGISTYISDPPGPGIEQVPLLTQDPVPLFEPSQIGNIIASEGFTQENFNPQNEITCTFPGTDIPMSGYIDPGKDPATLAPMIVRAVMVIKEATIRVQENPAFVTPFSRDSVRENQALEQQATWVFMGAATGTGYSKEDFSTVVYNQFENNTGKSVDQLPEEQKEKVDSGVDDFWDSFMAVGVEAKVIKVKTEEEETSGETDVVPEKETTPEGETGPEEVKDESPCTVEVGFRANPPYDLDMKIADEWGTPEERQSIIDTITSQIGRDVHFNGDSAFDAYDISHNPTSAVAFWKTINIGGFASAYANAVFRREDGSWERVGGTELLSVSANGRSDFTMTYHPGDHCSSFVVGVSVARVRASSRAFDAMAGNELGENDQDQLYFLRTTTFFGKLALKYLVECGTGRTSQSFGQYLRDAIKDEVEGAVKEAIIEEVESLARNFLNDMLDKMGLDVSIEDLPTFEFPDFGDLCEEFLGFNPLEPVEEYFAFVEKGIESFFNSFFWSNTYATANGALVIRVGSNTGSARVNTRVLYTREAQEDTDEAMSGTGEDCKEVIVSDVKPNSLTITTNGFSDMTAQAARVLLFGNGNASAYLESMQVQVLVGVCICPDGKIHFEVVSNNGWYTRDLNPLIGTDANQMADDLTRFLQGKIKSREINAATSSGTWKDTVEGYVRDWAGSHRYNWTSCD